MSFTDKIYIEEDEDFEFGEVNNKYWFSIFLKNNDCPYIQDYIKIFKNFNGFSKPQKVINKMFKKRRRRENAKRKCINGLTPLLLPHDIENLICSFVI